MVVLSLLVSGWEVIFSSWCDRVWLGRSERRWTKGRSFLYGVSPFTLEV